MKLFQSMLLVLFTAVLAAFVGLQVYTYRMVDNTAPVISFDSEVLELPIDAPEERLLEGVTAMDDTDGDLTGKVMIQGSTQLLTEDTVKVSYIVFDASNNIATASRTVRYLNYERPKFSLDAPLTYPRYESVKLLEHLHATDVKDGDISHSIRASLTNLTTSIADIYTVKVQVINSLGDSEILPLKVVILETRDALPTFELSDYILYLKKGASYRPERYIQNAQIPGAVQIDSHVDTDTPGTYYTTYSLQTPTERPDVYQTYTVCQTIVVR